MSFDLSFQRSFDASFRLSFEASDERSDALSFETSDARSDAASLEMSDGMSDEVSLRRSFLGSFEGSFPASLQRSFHGSIQRYFRLPIVDCRLAGGVGRLFDCRLVYGSNPAPIWDETAPQRRGDTWPLRSLLDSACHLRSSVFIRG